MFEVRHELPDDAAAIAEVSASATASLRQTYRPNSKALANKARLSRKLSRLVAVFNGRVVGTIQYYQDGDRFRFLGIGVLPGHRKHGVARALVEALKENVRHEGARRLTAYTIRETGNVLIFECLGFQVISEDRAPGRETTSRTRRAIRWRQADNLNSAFLAAAAGL